MTGMHWGALIVGVLIGIALQRYMNLTGMVGL